MVTVEDIKDKYWFEKFEDNLMNLRGFTVEHWLNVSKIVKKERSNVIGAAFIFSDTKEGQEYWKKIYDEEIRYENT